MKRRYRVALEVLGPVPLATLLLLIVFVISEISKGRFPLVSRKDFTGIFFYLFYGYIFAGLPSLISAGLIEWRFAHGLHPHSWRAVSLMSLLGLASGLLVATSFTVLTASGGSRGAEKLIPFCYVGTWGLTVGFLLGLLIKILSRPKA